MSIAISRYYTMVTIDAAGKGRGYKIQPIHRAKKFFLERFPELDYQDCISEEQEQYVQTLMLRSLWQNKLSIDTPTNVNILNDSGESICLRCYISHIRHWFSNG